MSESINSHIRIVSYNTRGLRNVTIPSLFNEYDIVLLQETLLCKQDLGILNSLSPDFQGTGVSVTDTSLGLLVGRPVGGIAILWRKTFASVISEVDLELYWLSGICINAPNSEPIYIFSVYLAISINRE